MACWLDQASSNTELCDAIDEMMKRDQDVLLDSTLGSGESLDIPIGSFADLLEDPSNLSVDNGLDMSPLSPPCATNVQDYSSSQNPYEMPVKSHSTFPMINSQANSAASNYSTLGISPQFTTLSIHPHQSPYSSSVAQENNHSFNFQVKFPPSSMPVNSKTNLHPPPYTQQQNNLFGGSYGFDSSINNGQSDVKRFRSASMNEGATQQQTRIGPQLLDPYRMRSSTYVEPSYYYNNKSNESANTTMTTTSSASSRSNELSSNNGWPYVDCSRPTSTSFSEVLDQHHQQQQINAPGMTNNLSASYEGSLFSIDPSNVRRGFTFEPSFQTKTTTNHTLYSLNQPTGVNGTQKSPSSINLKPLSLVGFPVEEIKSDPDSPVGLVEQQNKVDHWSEFEQDSSDPLPDNEEDELTSDDETATTVSTGFNAELAAMKPTSGSLNSISPFWQYNIQAKGPKTKRVLYLKERDPHLSREFSDPVYQIKLSQAKGQTSTKLRKGDGNDVTPNAMKLYQLGKQIRDLSASVSKTNSHPSSVYHGIYHFESHTNANDSAEVKKEKNKIASRACRLRKKAQHEANKLKLHGLNEEHKTLIELIASIKLLILKRCQDGQLVHSSSANESLEAICSQMIASKYNHSVAGNTDGFIQGIIHEMENFYNPKPERSQSLHT